MEHYSISDDFFYFYSPIIPIPVAARCKAWVYDSALAGIAGSNSAWKMDVCFSCECCVCCPYESYRVWGVWVGLGATITLYT